MTLEILHTPLFAFIIYLALVGLLSLFGRRLAGPGKASELKSSTYASGEASPTRMAAPGYQPFFLIALFFAILHLGILVVGSGMFTIVTGVYLVGLMVALLALILG